MKSESERSTKLDDDEVYNVNLRVSKFGYFLKDDTGREQLFTDANKLCGYLRGLWQASLPTVQQLKMVKEPFVPTVAVTFAPQPKRRGAPPPTTHISLEDLGL